LYHIAVVVPLVVDARRNVVSIFGAPLAVEIVTEGIGTEAIVVRAVVKRVVVPFVLKRVFLLSML
jgi:cation transporter-like permease